jgi:glycosyltransferase involved in cell wall biosynthesis
MIAMVDEKAGAGTGPSVAPAAPVARDELEVSVLMPCLNEAATIETCIRKAGGCLEALGIAGEILIADNGSTDGSQALATAAGGRVVTIAERGYGSALRGGIAAARGTFIIIGDADDSYDFTRLGPFIDKLRSGDELVMGNRFAGGIAPGAMPALHRYLGNPVLTGVGRLFFGSPCGDFHCGMRGFNRRAIARLDLRTTGMEFASELIVKATLNGLRMSEVPTTLKPDGRMRPPHLRSWRDGWRHMRFLLMYSPRWLFLYPGLLLMVLGTIVGLWLIPGPRQVGSIHLDLHTLLYAAAAVMIGFESVTFAIFARVFARNEGLLPPDAALDKWLSRISLETGLAVGTILVVFGIAMSVAALKAWSNVSFSNLNPSRESRLVIPAVTALILGCQTILSSFMLSILGLARK